MHAASLRGGLAAILLATASCAAESDPSPLPEPPEGDLAMSEVKTATFGAGCFWCTEAFFQDMDGVVSVTSGYTGGKIENPSYQQVCTGSTGHAEVVAVKYIPAKIAYQALVDRFFEMHDPTTMNRQGADVGTQYRSVIFYHDDEQRQIAEATKARLNASGAYGQPIVTEVVDAQEFYAAEDYHQDYFRNNPNAPYSLYIRDKMKKLK